MASEPSGRRSTEQCWTAVSLLNEIQTLCQREQHTLTHLTPRLRSEDPILMCLHIRLATLKAQRENVSYSGLLAAQQSWETWWLNQETIMRIRIYNHRLFYAYI
ncbi:hypothetical protein FQA47_002614 [Oryzias melastigma]|uniref:Uncharacterized protein n=1 Tax=Oryzias melastigma TaxID=30732 RepID=A0A834KXX9_ORYME|nr:hypothetical protein FQA47_002614 [Oryzias melastigma]